TITPRCWGRSKASSSLVRRRSYTRYRRPWSLIAASLPWHRSSLPIIDDGRSAARPSAESSPDGHSRSPRYGVLMKTGLRREDSPSHSSSTRTSDPSRGADRRDRGHDPAAVLEDAAPREVADAVAESGGTDATADADLPTAKDFPFAPRTLT